MTAKAITERFVQAIDQLCTEKGIKVKELCEGLPFTAGYVTNLRKRPQSIGSLFIVALYKKHKISPLWILTGEGEIKTDKQRNQNELLEAILANTEKIKEIEGDIIKSMLEAIISVNILPTDVKKKLAALGTQKKELKPCKKVKLNKLIWNLKK